MLRYSTDSQAREAAAGLIQDGARLPGARPANSPLDIWVEAQYASIGGGGRTGEFGVVYLGADYVVSPKLLVGVLTDVDWLHARDDGAAVDGSAHGWMIGTYSTLRLADHLFLQSRSEAGRADNTVSPFLTYTDHFGSSRWLTSNALVGDWAIGGLFFRPRASFDYISATSESYIDSNGVLIPSVRATLGQIKLVPEVSMRQRLADGTIVEPWGSLQSIWNIGGAGSSTDLGGTLAGPQGLRGKIELGLKTQFWSGMSVDLRGSYDGLGTSDYRALEGSANVRVPLN